MAASDLEFSAVVMAYDEVETIEKVVLDLHETLTSMDRPFEVLVVDDGSRDGTGAIADRLASRIPQVSVIHHDANLGLGSVYRAGFDTARGANVTFFPADGQYPAIILERFARVMAEHDLVLGYLTEWPGTLTARVLSWLERLLYRLLFGSFPKFQGIFMVRRSVLDEIELCSTGRGWGIVMELVLKATRGGYRTISVPTDVRPRTHGTSKVRNLRNIWANLKQLVTIRRHF